MAVRYRHFLAVPYAWLLMISTGCSDAPPAADVPGREQLNHASESVGNDLPADVPTSAKLVLAGEGLIISGRESGVQKIAFGEPAAKAVSAVQAVLGKPMAVETLEECGPGPLQVTRFNGLTVVAQDDKFAGWTMDGRDGPHLPMTTADIGIGSTRQSLARAYRAQVFDSSLGVEFTAGGLSGLLSGDRTASKITNLWAGATCIMR